MDSQERLLDAAGLRHACDLDLLLFFNRHPDALIANEDLMAFLGYDPTQLAKSLDLLVERQLVARSQNPAHFACLYQFRAEREDQWLRQLLEVASTIGGRRHLRQLLRQRHSPSDRAPLLGSGGHPSPRLNTPESAHG